MSKFNNNEENLNFVDKMIEYGRKIIKDNAGKNIEISFVIGSSGENLKLKDEDFNQSTEEHRNHLTVEQIFKIRNLNIRVNQGKGEFPFLVHNHTTDKPPSPEDFNTYIEYRYTCGIIFTNKGSIYLYVVKNKYLTDGLTKPEIKEMRKSILDSEKNNTEFSLTKDDIYNMSYFQYRKYGFKFKHIYIGRIN